MRECDIWLLEEFEKRNNKNRKYSLRSYARDLEVTPAYLSRAMKGQLNISSQMAQDFCHRLKKNSVDSEVILNGYEVEQERVKEVEHLIKEELEKGMAPLNIKPIIDREAAELVDWYQPLMFQLIEEFSGSESEIQNQIVRKVKVDIEQVEFTIKKFIEHELIVYKNDCYIKLFDGYTIQTLGDGVGYENLLHTYVGASEMISEKFKENEQVEYGFHGESGYDSHLYYTLLPVSSRNFSFEKMLHNFYYDFKKQYQRPKKPGDELYCFSYKFVKLNKRLENEVL